MERNLLVLLTFAMSLSLSAQQIPNGGFEQWSTNFLFEGTESWRTGNAESGIASTTKITGAPQGTYAARMETTIAGGDSTFGFVLLGDIGDFPVRGTPFGTDISSVSCWMRYDQVGNDSALAIIGIWSNGILVANKEWRFGGEQLTWDQRFLQLDAPVSDVDSVMIGFASSDPFNSDQMSHGSWLELDEVLLVHPSVPIPDLLPNHDFELWMDVSVEDPDGWNTFNAVLYWLAQTSVARSTDAYVGNYSARLTTLGAEGDTTPGFLTNGELDDWSGGGVPYATNPGTFTGAYKFAPMGIDTATIAVLFKNAGALIGSAVRTVTIATNDWTPFSLNVALVGVPDTMIVVASSGQQPGTALYVDALDLTGGNVSIGEALSGSTRPYPNPAIENVVVPSLEAGSRVRIMDLSGRVLYDASSNTFGTMTIPLNGLQDGTYLLHRSGPSGTTTDTFVKVSR